MAIWPLRLFVYGAGEAINGAGALDVQIAQQLSDLSKVVTNRAVAAAAQLDSESAQSVRFVLDPAGRIQPERSTETNTGDPRELLEFAAWASNLLPAERTVLVLSGHGAGWQDSLADRFVGVRAVEHPSLRHMHSRSLFRRATRFVLFDASNRDFLSNVELAVACEQIASMFGKKIDVVVFDACLMMSWEIAHEVSTSVAAMVGSMDELSSQGIGLADPAHDLSQNPNRAPSEIASIFAQRFVPRAPFDSCVALDLQNTAWVESSSNFAKFALELRTWLGTAPSKRRDVRQALSAASLSMAKFTEGSMADLGALSTAVAAVPDIPAVVRDALASAVQAITACVVGRTAGTAYSTATGVSVFSPTDPQVYGRNRSEYGRLRFAADTGWAATLESVFAD